MKDRTPVLYTLKKIINDKMPFYVALEKAEQFYNLSKEDKKLLSIDTTGILRHQYILRLEIKINFPEYDLNDDSALLLSIGLFELRNAKTEIERDQILKELETTLTSRGINVSKEDIQNLFNLSKNKFIIPDEYKEDPFEYNSYVFNTPSWLIHRYYDEFGPDKTIELLKSNLSLPNMFLGVNTTKATLDSFKDDSRFELIPTINSAFENGGSILVKTPGRASNIKEVLDGKLYVQDLSYAKALDALPMMQYYKALHIGGRTGTTASSLAIRLSSMGGLVSSAYTDSVGLARAKSLFRRLGLTNVGAYQSSLKMIKTVEEYDSYDITVVTPSSTHIGQAKRRPDVTALFSIEQLRGLTNTEYETLVEASYFPRVGGTLEYIVPSFLPEEGHQVIEKFLNDKSNVNKYKLVVEKTILPVNDNDYSSDGLYYAILTRIK